MNKFEGLMNAHPRKRYKSFAATAADTETVWLDCDPTQLVPTEPCPISVWTEEMFASAVCPDKAIYSIEVHEFCELLMANPRLCLHELSGIMALSQRRGCHHGEITASA